MGANIITSVHYEDYSCVVKRVGNLVTCTCVEFSPRTGRPKRTVFIPAVDWKKCSKEVYVKKYALPEELADQLAKICVLIREGKEKEVSKEYLKYKRKDRYLRKLFKRPGILL